MELTPAERLILAHQYEILIRLTEDADEKDRFRVAQAVIQSGYSTSYGELEIKIHDPASEETQREVIDVLEMHRTIGDAVKAHGIPDGLNGQDMCSLL